LGITLKKVVRVTKRRIRLCRGGKKTYEKTGNVKPNCFGQKRRAGNPRGKRDK